MQFVLGDIFKFQVEDQILLKNGDTKYFGFITTKFLKTYGYISESQLAFIQPKKIMNLNEKNPRTNFLTKKEAIDRNYYFNIGILNIDHQYKISAYKKHPLLQFLLSDQPEVFHKVINKNYSFKKMNGFRFSDFDFTTDHSKQGICYRLKDASSSSELCSAIFGNEYPKNAKKVMMKYIHKNNRGTITLNYELVRIIDFLKLCFNNEEIIQIIEHKYTELINSPLLKDIGYTGLHRPENNEGVLKYLKEFKDPKKRFQELKRFNVPTHVLHHFTKVMNTAFDYFKPDVSKNSDALYLYNTISRDYGRLKVKNFKLKALKQSSFKEIINTIDGLEVGDYKFVVPKDYHTLINWGSSLANCAGNFETISENSNKLFIGILKNNKITFLLDYKNKEVKQFKGFKNSKPNNETLKTLMKPILPFIYDPDYCIKKLSK